MHYTWEAGKPRRVMHIARVDALGNFMGRALCDSRLPFNRTINAPFALGRKVCKKCRAEANRLAAVR